MYKILKALPILLVALACCASTASARTLPLHRVSAKASWLAQVDATTLAFGSNHIGSAAMLLRDGTGTPRAVAPPAGCGAATAGSGHLLFQCPLGPNGVVELDQRVVVEAADGMVQATSDFTVPAQPIDATTPDVTMAIGDEWLDGGWLYVNWHTGAVQRPTGDGPASYADLDAPALQVPLCAPLDRLGTGMTATDVSGPWVLRNDQLWHCGSADTYNFPAKLRPLALRGGWLVLWRPTHYETGGPAAQLEIQRLRDGRRWALQNLRSVNVQRLQFAATSRRLLILGEGETTHPIDSVMLPQR